MHRPPPSVEWCAEVVTNVNVFSGAFERQLDDKGRLALPSKLRIDLGERVYLTKGFDRSVTVVPEETFRAEASRLAARVETGDADRAQLARDGAIDAVEDGGEEDEAEGEVPHPGARGFHGSETAGQPAECDHRRHKLSTGHPNVPLSDRLGAPRRPPARPEGLSRGAKPTRPFTPH